MNAPAFAESLGLQITETRLSAPGDYSDMLELSAAAEGRSVSVGGAFFGATPRIIAIRTGIGVRRPNRTVADFGGNAVSRFRGSTSFGGTIPVVAGRWRGARQRLQQPL